jgi:hypothetical protein
MGYWGGQEKGNGKDEKKREKKQNVSEIIYSKFFDMLQAFVRKNMLVTCSRCSAKNFEARLL